MRFIPLFVFTVVLTLQPMVFAGNREAAETALKELFNREVPERSDHLRALWEEENMLDDILSMDTVRDWAGLEPGMVEAVTDCVAGSGALKIPVTIDPGKHLRIENNFMAGHHDGFRNMMCMGIEVENFTSYRTIQFSYKTALHGAYELWFRIYDRTGGWIDWTIPKPEGAIEWTTATLAVPPQVGDMVDIQRIGGVMFELRAENASVTGELFLDHIQLLEDTLDGIRANIHVPPAMDYDSHVDGFVVPNAYSVAPAEFILNLSPLEIPVWENDHEATMRCLKEELKRFETLQHLGVFINPGTRKNIYEDPDYIPNLQELLVKASKYLEEKQIPFYQSSGVEGHEFYPPSLMFAVEQAAPTMCKGFIFGESSVETNGHVGYLVELMDYLAPKKKKVLYFQQTSYWVGIMQHNSEDAAALMKAIQNPKYRDVFVPMWENLLPGSQGLCFGSTMGFWRGGLTSDWGVSAQSWGYANLCLGGTADMPGHWWLRMFLHVVTTGGRYIEIEPVWPFDGENTEGQIRHSMQWGHTQRWIGDTRSQLECTVRPGEELMALRYFDKLLGAGVARAPASPGNLLSLPDVTMQVIEPTVHSETRYQWGIFRRCLDTNWWSLGDCPNAWEMALQTHPTDIFRPLYHSSHIYDQTVPITGYGMVSITPPGSSLPEQTQIIECDGARVYENGKWLDIEASHQKVVDAYTEKAASLPFTANGCFLSVVEVAPKAYMAYLIDPEERFPVGVDTALQVKLNGEIACQDILSRETIPIDNDCVAIQIPPAGFRVLYIQQR